MVKLTPEHVRARKDGRFGTVDFTLWPQWFYPEHPHLPYVLRRPEESDLREHPLNFLWWDVQERHLEPEPGQLFAGLGKLKSSISGRLWEEAHKLREDAQECNMQRNGRNCQGMNMRTNHLVDISINLKYGVHYFRDLVLKVAAFQRLYLEVRASIDNFKIWVHHGSRLTDQPLEVNQGIMGAITDQAEVVQTFWRLGVPVWYVRHPCTVPKDINIVCEVRPTLPDPKFVRLEDWPDDPFPTIMKAAIPSAARLMACQSSLPGTLDLQRIRLLSESSTATEDPSRMSSTSTPLEEARECIGSNWFIYISWSHRCFVVETG